MSVITLIELPQFSKQAAKIFQPEELIKLRRELALRPEQGAVIPGTSGLRKMRWAASGRGKRGGARIIYFYHIAGWTIYLMAAYAKNEQEDLSEHAKKQLKSIIETLKKGV